MDDNVLIEALENILGENFNSLKYYCDAAGYYNIADYKETIKETEMENKELKNIKTTSGFILYKNKPVYITRVQGVLTSGSDNPFMKDDLSENDDEIIDFVFTHIDNNLSILMDKTNQFKGEKLNKEILSTLPEKVEKYIINDYDLFRGIYKDMDIKYLSLKENSKIYESVLKPYIEENMKINNDLTEFLHKYKAIDNEDLLDFIKRYAFKEHILISGPRGIGKTYTIDKYLREQEDITIEFIGCHNAIESIDLLGYYVRTQDGSFVWLDGVLSGAFRKAQEGKVALFMDELLRTPSRELNILVAALTPDSEGYFNLRTNRIVDTKDGVGEVELIRVSKENLWIVGTTNVGADYEVGELDVAFQDRFISKDISSTKEGITAILSKYTEDTTIISKLVNLYEQVETLVNAQELSHTLNVRHLTKVLTYANNMTEIKQYLLDFIPNVCSRNVDGKFNETEVSLYKKLIKGM